MFMQKNELVTVTIEDIGINGEGIGKVDGYTLFIKDAIIGDVDGLGLALRAEICAADGFTPDKAMMDRIVDEGIKGDLMVDGKRYGLVLDVGGYYKNVITLAPSLNITREEVE